MQRGFSLGGNFENVNLPNANHHRQAPSENRHISFPKLNNQHPSRLQSVVGGVNGRYGFGASGVGLGLGLTNNDNGRLPAIHPSQNFNQTRAGPSLRRPEQTHDGYLIPTVAAGGGRSTRRHGGAPESKGTGPPEGRNFRAFLSDMQRRSGAPSETSSKGGYQSESTDSTYRTKRGSQAYQQKSIIKEPNFDEYRTIRRMEDNEGAMMEGHQPSISKMSTATGLHSHAPGRRISLYLDNRPRPSLVLPPVSTSEQQKMEPTPRNSVMESASHRSSIAQAHPPPLLMTKGYASKSGHASLALDPVKRKYAGFFHDFVQDAASDDSHHIDANIMATPLSRRPPPVGSPEQKKRMSQGVLLPQINRDGKGVLGRL